jgi:hypothetical protein
MPAFSSIGFKVLDKALKKDGAKLLEEATAVHIEEMVKYKSNKVQTANRGS